MNIVDWMENFESHNNPGIQIGFSLFVKNLLLSWQKLGVVSKIFIWIFKYR
jgi:hypothetical protein